MAIRLEEGGKNQCKKQKYHLFYVFVTITKFRLRKHTANENCHLPKMHKQQVAVCTSFVATECQRNWSSPAIHNQSQIKFSMMETISGKNIKNQIYFQMILFSVSMSSFIAV